MKKKQLLFCLLAISSNIFAGNGHFIQINNNIPFDIKLSNFSQDKNNCWQEDSNNDFITELKKGINIPQGTESRKYYAEEYNAATWGCINSGQNIMYFDMSLATRSGEVKTVKVKIGGSSGNNKQYWQFKFNNYDGDKHPYTNDGDQGFAHINDLYNDLCIAFKDSGNPCNYIPPSNSIE